MVLGKNVTSPRMTKMSSSHTPTAKSSGHGNLTAEVRLMKRFLTARAISAVPHALIAQPGASNQSSSLFFLFFLCFFFFKEIMRTSSRLANVERV